MKSLKTLLYTLAAICAFSTLSFGQQSMFGMNYNISLPLGSTRDYINQTSFRGGSFEGRGFVSDRVSVGGWISWEVFKERLDNVTYNGNGVDVTGTQVRYLNMLPILVTSHYYFGDFAEATPYFGGGLGAYRSFQRTDIGLVSFSNDHWHFGFAPEIGIYLPLSYSTGLNLAAKYNYATKSSGSSYSYLTLVIGLSWLDF